MVEVLNTWWFVYVILIVKDKHSRLTSDSMLGSATVGLALMTNLFMAGGVSGGCLNPALGLTNNL